MGNKQVFIELFNKHIKRDGAEELLNYLNKSDFFTAPSSSRFHSNYDGGLVDHSVKVFNRFIKILKSEFGEDFSHKINMESVAIIALLHDLCKVDYYKTEMRNVKVDGTWVQKPYYTVADKLPYGHGEKSVYIISGFMKLTRDEAMAINWHMGEYDLRAKSGSYSISQVFYEYPISFLFHLADLSSTYLDEERST